MTCPKGQPYSSLNVFQPTRKSNPSHAPFRNLPTPEITTAPQHSTKNGKMPSRRKLDQIACKWCQNVPRSGGNMGKILPALLGFNLVSFGVSGIQTQGIRFAHAPRYLHILKISSIFPSNLISLPSTLSNLSIFCSIFSNRPSFSSILLFCSKSC